jgi:hypothetical protein
MCHVQAAFPEDTTGRDALFQDVGNGPQGHFRHEPALYEEMNMRFLKKVPVIVLFLLSPALVGRAQVPDKPFPSNDEINLLLTQADRAIGQYKATLDLEKTRFEKSSAEAEALAKDKEVSSGWDEMFKGMKIKPQAFNSRFGLEIVLLLDDASRNMLLCSNQASLLIPQSGSVSEADTLLHLVQTCSDTSTLIYTVSENAAALYQKYLAAEAQLVSETAEVATKCTDILKKNAASPKH